MTSTFHPATSVARTGAAAGRRSTRLTADVVTALQSMRAYPSISILATTRPGPRMTSPDREKLQKLSAHATRRLDAEQITDRQRLADAMAAMIDDAARQPADRAVALYVSAVHQCRISLPAPVADRCVVDPTFATRDLVRALHNVPRHTVLLLSNDQARLLHGHGTRLEPVRGGAFPAYRGTGGRRSERLLDFLRRVDRALGAALRLNPMPLIVVGAEPTASTFVRLSRNTARLAGMVDGDHLTTPARTLGELTRPALREYLRSRGEEALALIEQRAGDGRVLRDITTAWLAARWERPELLAVEEDYFYPARLEPNGDILLPATDVDHPDVIDDAVDELIEIVLSRGGWIALLPPGRLPAGTHLALSLRRR